MTILRRVLSSVNRVIRPMNIELRTLTAEKAETTRLAQALAQGAFSEMVFPVGELLGRAQTAFVLDAVAKYKDRFSTFADPSRNDVGFQYDNGFFSSPDVEVLYTIMRERRPKLVLEFGCGNSTKITRQAIIDGKFECRLVCVDPKPRAVIAHLADDFIEARVETLKVDELASMLGPETLFFVDTSHEVVPGGDVQFIYCQLFPRIPVGTMVHVHDIFLPFDYPPLFAVDQRLPWGEQYLVNLLLQESRHWEVLWPGYYLDRTMAGFVEYFPYRGSRVAQSFWMERVRDVSESFGEVAT